MDPHPLCLLETAYPLRPSTLSAGPPTSRLPPCHRLLTTPTKIFDGPTQMSRPRIGKPPRGGPLFQIGPRNVENAGTKTVRGRESRFNFGNILDGRYQRGGQAVLAPSRVALGSGRSTSGRRCLRTSQTNRSGQKLPLESCSQQERSDGDQSRRRCP